MSRQIPEVRPEPLWTKAEVAAYLKVSSRTVDKYCAERVLSFIQLPSGKRFEPGEIRALVADRKFPKHHSQDRNPNGKLQRSRRS